MTAIEIIRAALKERKKTQKSLALELGVSPQNFNKKLTNNTISAREFFQAMDAMGYDVIYQNKTTGEAIKIKERKPGVIPRVSMVVNQIRYDTFKADALCHTEIQDGWLMELYRDFQGRFFIVHWTEWENVNPSVSPCEMEYAKSFYENHGDTTDDFIQALFEN
jgi:transcriptional regulator with XRE-family HTH domain